MTIDISLPVEFNKEHYQLMVKMIRIEKVSYFFIKDKVEEKPLLKDRTLELTFSDSFSLTEFAQHVKSPGIPGELINVIQDKLLEHKQLWS